MPYTQQLIQLASDSNVSLPSKTLVPGDVFSYNLVFNTAIKQIQLEWDITTTTAMYGQVYECFPDFVNNTYVETPITAAGQGQVFINLSGLNNASQVLGSDTSVMLKFGNTDPTNDLIIVSLNVLGITDN